MEAEFKPNHRSVALVRVDADALMNEAPFGILFIAHALRRHGFIPIVYHINERQIKDAVHDIVRQQPLFVGFSVITGLSLDAAIQASKAIKSGLRVMDLRTRFKDSSGTRASSLGPKESPVPWLEMTKMRCGLFDISCQ